MASKWEKKKIFIVVKTYPNVSTTYKEVVCTAGITEDGDWIRLYPVPFRYQDGDKQFHKYDWVEVDVDRHTADPRVESYRPNLDTLKRLKSVNTKHYWAERKALIMPLLAKSKECLAEGIKNKDTPGVSLGVIKPKVITDFIIEATAREYTKNQKAILKQRDIFGDEPKDLDKIPYKFSYKFSCDDERCKGHKLMIEDWEIAALYRKMLTKSGGDEDKANKLVRNKYEGFIKNNDVCFILGTTKPNHFTGTFVIIGVFYPLKEPESKNLKLF